MDISMSFFNMRICCMLSIESPHRGDSYEYIQYTLQYQYQKENHRELSQIQ